MTLLLIWTLNVGFEILIPCPEVFWGPTMILTSFVVLDEAFDPMEVEVLVFFFRGCCRADPELLALLCSFSLCDLFSSCYTKSLSFCP